MTFWQYLKKNYWQFMWTTWFGSRHSFIMWAFFMLPMFAPTFQGEIWWWWLVPMMFFVLPFSITMMGYKDYRQEQ